MLEFLNNLWWPFIFLELHRNRSLQVGPSEKVRHLKPRSSENFLIVDHPQEDHNEQEFKRLIIGGILDQMESSSKTREISSK